MTRRTLVLIFSACVIVPSLSAQQSNSPATLTLKPTAKTPPVLRVKSGDTVEIQTLITSSPKRLEEVVHTTLPEAIFVSAPSK